jgi:2-phosphoglycerate kinase
MTETKTTHIVITDQSHGLPYSKGLMASSLMVCGVTPPAAFRIAERIQEDLERSGKTSLTTHELRDLAAAALAETGESFSKRYLKWQAVEELDIPLIVMLGGATGVGKSTLATQLAARLGITRVISTDAIREVLRSALPRELMPELHASSFSADTAVRAPLPKAADPVIVGFQEQVAAVAVGIKALIARAIEEGTDMIVEGAHVVPGFLEGWEEEFKEAVLVPIVITVSDPALHASHFHMRALESRTRPVERYVSALDNIRKIQGHISHLATTHDVPLVDVFDLDSALGKIVNLVVEKATETAAVRGAGPASHVPALHGAPAAGRRPGRVRRWEVFGGRRRVL